MAVEGAGRGRERQRQTEGGGGGDWRGVEEKGEGG